MNDETPQPDSDSHRGLRPLRVWPAILLLIVLWAVRLGAQQMSEVTLGVMMARFMLPLLLSGVLVLWWLFFSRASIQEKFAGLLVLVVVGYATARLADETVQGFGIMIFAIPWGVSCFAATLVLMGNVLSPIRLITASLVAVLGFGYWDLIRTDEILANFDTKQSWRWEKTNEQEFLDSISNRQTHAAVPDGANQQDPIGNEETLPDPEWSAFRGPDRAGVQGGIVLESDWQKSPPVEAWRIRLGPGWSSFSVAGKRLFTQEQRGEIEAVVCYDADSGRELWVHQDEARFWEVVGGAGPRGTPTISGQSVYTLGANGLLTKLTATTGETVWQQNIKIDAGREPPQWGFSSSPLVTHGVVIVHGGGSDDRGVLAYDEQSGELRWGAPAGDHSYSSPQLATLSGKECVMMLDNDGLKLVDPVDGRLLGQHDWEFNGYRVVQPLVVDEDSVLIGTPMGNGTVRVSVSWNDGKFDTEQEWHSKRMSPYFNDYVSHDGFLYGFDNNIFACVNLADGQRMWKRGRYGNGQVLLLPTGRQLLVTTEQGELVLLEANSEKHVELGRYQLFEGRTWNHPVLIGDRLYMRNAEEAVCVQLPVQQPSMDPTEDDTLL